MGNIICTKKRRCRPFAIPLAAGVLYQAGILLTPAVGALFMSLSTVIVAVNARFLKIEK